MSSYTPSREFDAAASYLSKSSSATNIPNSVKLELYGLFKYVTVAPSPNTSRPSIFDMTGRAKWDAWSTSGKMYQRYEDAEERYLGIAKSLGWSPEAGTFNSENGSKNANGDDEFKGSGGANTGLGLFVSTMVAPVQEKDASVCGMAISNDVDGLSRFLDHHPEIDANVTDEFVGLKVLYCAQPLGCDVPSQGYTPLHLACDRGNLAVVKLLVGRGADPAIRDPDGYTAVELANIAGHNDIEEYLSSLRSAS